MERRTIIVSSAGLIGGLAGCVAPGSESSDPSTQKDTGSSDDQQQTDESSSTETVRAAEAHTVRVETLRPSMSGRETRVIAAPDGKLTVQRTCNEKTVESSHLLDPSIHDALVNAVLEADLSSMADSYECSGDCPKDIPGKRYTLTVDGAETTVFVEAQADDVPTGIVEIQQRLDEAQEGVAVPSCETSE